MTQIEKVNAVWDRIEKWYAANLPGFKFPSGAAPADIIALETHMGLTFPEELKTSLMRHDGVEPWTKGQLLPLEVIRLLWDRWVEWSNNGSFDGFESIYGPNEFLQKCWFDKLWIPIDGDSSGNGFLIDLNPGPKGTIGQVIDLCHETGPQGPKHADYVSYLEESADLLESGHYMVDDGFITPKSMCPYK